MGDAKDESVKTVNMECNESNKRKFVDKNEAVVPTKKRPVEEPVEPESFSLNYLPDQILLDIFRHLSPMELKAIAFTCVRMHRLIRDYTLWTEVDARETKTGTKRLRWFLENGFHENTVSIKLRGFSKELKGCLGIVDTTKSVTDKDDDNIIYTNLVTLDDSDDEDGSCDDDDDEEEAEDEGNADAKTETKPDDAPVEEPTVVEARDPVRPSAREQPKVVKMLRDEYLSKKPRVAQPKAVEPPVQQTSCGQMGPCPPRVPRRCCCTGLACPGRMSKKIPWPKPVLDRMDELQAMYKYEEKTTCSKPTFTFTKDLLSQLVTKCPNITELDLGYCNIDCYTTSLANFPSNLVKLSLCGTRMYNVPKPKTMLYHIHERLPRLEYLNVSKCEWLTPDTWLSMSKLPNLRVLIATDCPCMKDFIAYASLATKYGFPVLEYVDFRGSPLSDSEVSALGWVPTLRELYLSPPIDHYDDTFNLHTHFKNDPLMKVEELESWEMEDYMNPSRSRRAGKKQKKRRGGGNLPLKKRKLDNNVESNAFQSDAPKTIVFPTYDEYKATAARFRLTLTRKVISEPQPGSSKDDSEPQPGSSKDDSEPQPGSSKDDSEPQPGSSKDDSEPQPGSSKDDSEPQPGSSKDDSEPQPGSSKDDSEPQPGSSKDDSEPQPGSSKDDFEPQPGSSKDNSEQQPGSSKDNMAPSTSKASFEPLPGSSKDDVEPSTAGANNGQGANPFQVFDEDSIEEVLPPIVPFRPNEPDEHKLDRSTGSVLDMKQILICQGGSIYQYTYDRDNPSADRDIGFANHLPAGYVMVPDPVPNPRGAPTHPPPATNNMRRVRMVANLGNHLQLIDRQFNRQLELFRCTSLVTDVSVRYFGRSVGDEFVHIGPRRNRVPPNIPREMTRNDVSNLRVLVVSGYPGITDVSLKHLSSAAPFLTFLDVRDTKVTEEGVNRFLSVRPHVEVLYGHFDDRGGHRYPGFLVT